MNESSNTPILDGTPSPSEPFYQTWLKAVTKPNEQTYADIANAPDASPNKAYLWVFVTSLISSFLVLVTSFIFNSTQYGGDVTSLLISLICAVPIGALILTLLFAADVAIVQWVAKMFKGTGTYSQLLYALAAIAAPVSLVSGVIGIGSAIPLVGLCFTVLSVGIALYTMVLNIMATKGVNKFGWGEAIGSVLLPAFVLVFVCGCLVIGILILLGPVIGDVFSTINSSLGY